LLQGASSTGKSQLVCWHTTNQANADTLQTIEESHEFLEDFQGRKILVEILDTGGDPNYVSLLEDWVSRANVQVLVFNLEDRATVEYLKQHHNTLATTNVLARVVVGNLPSGKQENRVVTKETALKLTSAFGSQAYYLETNTRTGEGVKQVFASLLERVYGQPAPAKSTREEKLHTTPTPAITTHNAPMTVHVAPHDKDAEILALKTRQAELETRLTVQEKTFTSRLESLEGKLQEISVAYHKIEEQSFAARLELLEARLTEGRLMHLIEEMALNKSVKTGPETESTPNKSKLSKQPGDLVKKGLFTTP